MIYLSLKFNFQERSSANLTSDTRLSYEDSGSNDSSYESYGFNEISFVERYQPTKNRDLSLSMTSTRYFYDVIITMRPLRDGLTVT